MTGRTGYSAIALALLLLTGMSVQARDGADDLPQIEPASAAPQERKSRLKYQRGPTCMCAKGTGEEEIRAAEERRRAGEKK